MPPRILIIGIGGAGSAAIDRMIHMGLCGVEFVAMDTDAHALVRSAAPTRLHLGEPVTRGLGAGGDPRLGEQAARSQAEPLQELVEETDLVCLAAGLGGGTGTGGAPILADLCRQVGALTVAMVSRPFGFEGRRRGVNAQRGREQLRDRVDALVTIAAERLLPAIDPRTTITQAFAAVDEVLGDAIEGLTDLVTADGPGRLTVEDIRSLLAGVGEAGVAVGRGSGGTRAATAARSVVSSPLLEGSFASTTRVLLRIAGGQDLGLEEITHAAEIVARAAHPDALVLFGAATDPRLTDEIKITAIAAGSEPSHGPSPGGTNPRWGGPRPPDSAPIGAKRPRRPPPPSDHTGAVPELSSGAECDALPPTHRRRARDQGSQPHPDSNNLDH